MLLYIFLLKWPSLSLLQAQEVLLRDRPAIPYDLLSINVGITPAASTVPGAAQHTTGVKPIDRCAGQVGLVGLV